MKKHFLTISILLGMALLSGHAAFAQGTTDLARL